MKRYLVFLSLFALATLLDSLCVFPQYCGNFAIAPLLGAALISGGTSLLGSALGGLFGKSSQDSANAANIQMQRETNKQQMDMFNQNLDWTKYTYEDQKAYNERMLAAQRAYDDPSAQLKRLKDAGLNPYMMLGNLDAGKFQTAVAPTSSAPSAPSLTAPSMQPYDPTNVIQHGFDTVGQTAASYFRMQNEAEDAKGKHIDNITRLEKNRADIQVLLSNKKLNDATRRNLQAQTKRINKLLSKEYDALDASINMQKEETANKREEREVIKLQKKAVELNNAYQDWFNDWSKKNGEKQLQVLQSTIAANMANANLASKQALVATEQKILTQLQQKGIRIDNEQKKKLNKLLLEQQKLQNKGKELENTYGTNMWTFIGRALEWNNKKWSDAEERDLGKNGTTRWSPQQRTINSYIR